MVSHRPDKPKLKLNDNDDDISDYVKIRLALARMKALEKFREVRKQEEAA